jgi:hypothetical protein
MTLEEKRRAKYPDTDTFCYYNANPKNKVTTDCVIRALCTGMQKPYNEVVMELAQMQIDTGYDDGDSTLIAKYLAKHGWVKCKQPRKYDGTKYTGKEFCKKLQHSSYLEEIDVFPNAEFDSEHIIANIGGHHIVAIVEGQVYDIWNSTYKCIGNIWVKIF